MFQLFRSHDRSQCPCDSYHLETVPPALDNPTRLTQAYEQSFCSCTAVPLQLSQNLALPQCLTLQPLKTFLQCRSHWRRAALLIDDALIYIIGECAEKILRSHRERDELLQAEREFWTGRTPVHRL